MDYDERFLNETELNPINAFNNAYKKSSDIKEIQSILDEVKRYDIFDFLAKLSALNLIPENQNKSILFDTLVASVLTLNRNDYTSKNKMSSGRFRKIINRLGSLDLKSSIDPVENTFIENIMFYGNYYVFNGINYNPGYCLQNMIKTLISHDEHFNQDFQKLAFKLIQVILVISDSVANGLQCCIDNLEHKENRDIIIPGSKLEQIAKNIIIDNNFIRTTLQDDVLMEELYSDFGEGNFEKALTPEQQEFYNKPFIKLDKDNSIILNISSLASFAVHKVICLADKYNHKSELINFYNASIWKDCLRSFNNLGHSRITEDMGIEFYESNNYKEVLLNVFNNQVMIVTCINDDGTDYSYKTMGGKCPSDKFGELIEKRLLYLYEKLHLQNIKDEDIFHVAITNSFGREIWAGFITDFFYKPLTISPFDLRCISINEKHNSAFIPRYIRAKSKLCYSPNFSTELNYIEIYVNNDYSFYLNDNFNPKKNSLFIAPGDSIDYIIKATKKQKRHLVKSFNESYFTEVVLNDEEREIYANINYNRPRMSLYIKLNNVSVWVYCPEANSIEELNLYYPLVDTISFWLAECKKILEIGDFIFDIVKLKIELTGDPHDYYFESKESYTLEEKISVEVDGNEIKLIWTPEAFRLFNSKDNIIEKQLTELILRQLESFNLGDILQVESLEYIFENPLKKKMFNIDYIKYPYLKPLHDKRFRTIKAEDENELLDDIGSAVLASGKWTYGVIKDEDRTVVANFVVSYLYEMLQNQVKELRPDFFIELVCSDLEKAMYNLMLTLKRYAYDIACYPEKQEKILEDFNELNKSSRAMKFLAEYIAACPPNGSKILGEWQYERLLAICSLIIDWAYKNDLFFYRIFNTPIEILQSDRIGMKQDEFNKLTILNSYAREEQLNRISSPSPIENLPQTEFPNIQQELNDAFIDEYSFSFNDFSQCILEFVSYGDLSEVDVKKADKDELITSIIDKLPNLSREKVEKIIKCISLSIRDDYLKPEPPLRKEDVYPWRFNRELSFTRRPVIIRNNEVIWGNRQLFHMLMFTIDLIYEGKLKTRGRKLTELIGKISNKRGRDFNNKVYNKIIGIHGLIVDKNLKKINHKSIADDHGNTLGDIDLLYIVLDKKQIVVAEVKDFNFSKSPYEMDCEYRNMFVDDGNKKCFATRHHNRAIWVKNHIEDIKAQYRLQGDGWAIKEIFIVNERIISNAFYDVGYTIITYDNISTLTLRGV